MNWTQYQQQALTFVAVKGDLRAYVAYGLLSEVGEIAGVYAKQVRGDDADFRARLLSELGDVAWFIAVGAHCLGVDVGAITCADDPNLRTRYHLLQSLVWAADELALLLMRTPRPYYNTEVFNAVIAFTDLVQSEGFTVAEVLQANLDKLASRQQRGTIAGSGDER
jgi:hypothetical protein